MTQQQDQDQDQTNETGGGGERPDQSSVASRVGAVDAAAVEVLSGLLVRAEAGSSGDPSVTPALAAHREALAERVAAGRRRHGVGSDDYLPGNVQHLVSPIVGILRMREHDGTPLEDGDVSYFIDRLSLVLDLAQEAELADLEHGLTGETGAANLLRCVACSATGLACESLGDTRICCEGCDHDPGRALPAQGLVRDEPSEDERHIELADGLGRTEPYADPDLREEYDEDGEPIAGTRGAGWDVSFGCRMNFGPDPDGRMRVSVHVSDQAKRAGLAVSPTCPAQLRLVAAHLVAIADEHDAPARSDDGRTAVELTCPCGCPPDAHIGEIGCPCGLLDESPCSERATAARVRPDGWCPTCLRKVPAILAARLRHDDGEADR